MENEQTQKYENFIPAQNFSEDPKNTRIRILYPKKDDEHTYHFVMKVPRSLGGGGGGGKINYSYAEALLFV